MEPAQLETLIVAQDWAALDQVGAMGAAALPVLTRTMENAEPSVRQLTVLCLERVGGPDAARLLAGAFHDPDEQVRAYAADILLAVPDAAVLPEMKTAFATHEDPRVRSRAALIAGAIGDPSARRPLEKALAAERDTAVRDGIEQALARLGDARARAEVLEQLHSPDRKTKFESLAKIEYVHDRALVKEVAPLLHDSSEAMVLTASGPASVVLRMNDAAAKTIAVLLGQPFSFQLTGYRVCTDAELEEIGRYLRERKL